MRALSVLMSKTYEQINERIRSGKAVVYTAEEVMDLVRKKGAEKAAEEVDVVTTGTFGAMCSSGAFVNFGHSSPPIRMTDIRLNDVEAYGGLAAVDTYIGATALTEDPKGGYGGAHVIEDLIAGKKIHLRAWGPGTDCYVRKSIDTYITLDDINDAYLYNPRNCYQNYSVATNTSERTIYTYMGKLLPKMKNASFSSAGQLSPLLKDPHLETIGMGTRIFFGGGEGYVTWPGTQYKTNVEEVDGVPVAGARTLALIGDMKQMDSKFVRGLDITGYGISMAVGVGIPIPILNKEIMEHAAKSDEELFAEMVDYSQPVDRPPMARYSYAQLRSGKVEYQGRMIRTSSLSSYSGARKVASILKDWIEHKEFTLNQPVMTFPKEMKLKKLEERGCRNGEEAQDPLRGVQRPGLRFLHSRLGVQSETQRPQGGDPRGRVRNHDPRPERRGGEAQQGHREAGGGGVPGQGAGQAHRQERRPMLPLRGLRLAMPVRRLQPRPRDLGGRHGHQQMHRMQGLRERLRGARPQRPPMKRLFRYKETIATIVGAEPHIKTAESAIFEAREIIERKVYEDPFFRITYEPYPADPRDHELIQRMCQASELAGVGPFAGVAGAVATFAVERMVSGGADLAIVENGGDIAFYSPEPRTIGLFADHPVLKGVAFMMRSDRVTGVCSSSAKIGPSVSLGGSDVCTVFSDDVILADCCATALGNLVRDESSLAGALESIGSIEGVKGCLACIGDKVAVYGDLPEMVEADTDDAVAMMMG